MIAICFLFDPNVGGPHVRARGVYSELQRRGYEVRIAIPRGEGSAQAFHESAGLRVDRLAIHKPVSPTKAKAFIRYLLALPTGVARTARYLRATEADVVHVNGAFDLVPALAAKVTRTPLVWHLNDTAIPTHLAAVFGWMVKRLATRPVAAAQAVATHYGLAPSEVDILYAPVDTRRFTPANSEPRQPDEVPLIALVANWNPLKGQDRFIDVIAELVERGHHVRALIVGNFGPGQEAFWRPLHDSIVTRGLADHFTILGFVDDVPKALAAVDVSLLTSRSEACPISVLEAMASGIPQVCFNVGGVDELLDPVGPNPVGVSVPEGDVVAMVDAVEQVLGDSAIYEKLSASAPERARNLFSIDVCVSRHEQIYRAATGLEARA